KAKMANITLNYRVSSDNSIDIPPNNLQNTSVANLKNMIRNNVSYANFDLYVNDTARDVKKYMDPQNMVLQYFDINNLRNHIHILVYQR
ncbi:12673_t:CDS:1, partial [Gigaspora margarita]